MENNFVTKEEGNRRTKHVRLALMNQWNINHVKSVAAAKRMFVIQMKRMHTIMEFPAQAQRAQLPSTSQSQLNFTFSRGWIDDFIFVSINRSDIKPNF